MSSVATASSPLIFLVSVLEVGPAMRFQAAGPQRHHAMQRPLRDQRLNLRLFAPAPSAHRVDPVERHAAATLARGDLSELNQAQSQLLRALLGRIRDLVEETTRSTRTQLIDVKINAMLPGQVLARHTDDPEFEWRCRSTFPEWLLVAMHWSGKFAAQRIPIVTANIYLSGSGDLSVEGRDGEILIDSRTGTTDGSVYLFDADSLIHSVKSSGSPLEALRRVTVDDVLIDRERTTVTAGGESSEVETTSVRLSVHAKYLCFESAKRFAQFEGHRGEGMSTLIQRQQWCMERLAEDLPIAQRDYSQLGAEIIRHFVQPGFRGAA